MKWTRSGSGEGNAPLEADGSSSTSATAIKSSAISFAAGYSMIVPSRSMSISFFSGFGWAASSSSFAFNRSLRAVSTGPNTFCLSRWLFFFTALDRALFAMVVYGVRGGFCRIRNSNSVTSKVNVQAPLELLDSLAVPCGSGCCKSTGC